MKFHDELNPKIWNKDENKGETSYSLKSEVADKLMEIASFFIENNNIPEDAIEDIRLLGSSANYNYNKYSDIDLHLVVDFDKLHEDCPIVNDYAWAIKQIFNQEHDISIYDIPVEIYIEPIDQPANSNGVYSLIDHDWLKKPEKIEPTDNDVAVQSKFEEIAQAVDKIEDSEYADKLLDKIYAMRKAGLSEGGEFSTENLAFKLLRNGGYLDKLREMKKANIDKELTLEKYEVSENLIDGLKVQYPKANIEVGHGAIDVKDENGEIIICGDYSVVAKFLADNKNRFENYIGEKQTMRKTISERESWEPAVSKIGRNQYAIFATETGGAVKYVKSLADAFDWIEKNWDIPRNEVKVNENYKGTKTMRKTISENIEPSEIHAVAVANLPAEDIDHHESDLYIRKTPESEALIKQMENQSLLSTFRNQIDNEIWYELPFCYNPELGKNESLEENQDIKVSEETSALSGNKYYIASYNHGNVGVASRGKSREEAIETLKKDLRMNYGIELGESLDVNESLIVTTTFDQYRPWSGATGTYEKIERAGMLDELESFLEELYPEGISLTGINALLWFDGEYVLEALGLLENEEDEDMEESLKPVNEGNFDQQSTAWYDFCKYVKEKAESSEDFDEAVWAEADDLVYTSDIINVWSNMPGNLGSRTNEITELMKRDIIEGAIDDQEWIMGLDESLKSKNEELESFEQIVNDRIKQNSWEDLTKEEVEAKISDLEKKGWQGSDKFTLDMMILQRMKHKLGESLEVNEISDELKDRVTDARKKELKNADRVFVATRNKAWKDTEGMEPKARKEAIMNNDKLNRAEGRANKAARKLVNNRMLRKTQSESLADSILKEAHEVLSMNESAESTTWSFKANGFSKAMLEKQNTFGTSEVRCIIHENSNGSLEGTAILNYHMSKEQVEEAIKNALRENGFRTTVISELTNLY